MDLWHSEIYCVKISQFSFFRGLTGFKKINPVSRFDRQEKFVS